VELRLLIGASGCRRSVLEGAPPKWGPATGEAPARYRHRSVLHDLLQGRGRALRLHYGLKRLRPI